MDGDHFKMDSFKPNSCSRGTTIKRTAMMLVAKVKKKSQPRDSSRDLMAISFVGAAFVIKRSRTFDKTAVMPMVTSADVPKTLLNITATSGSDMINAGPANNKNIIGR